MTAHAMQGDRDRCLEAGMNDYLSKPIEATQLNKMIDQWVSREPSGSASKRTGAKTPADSAPAKQPDKVHSESAPAAKNAKPTSQAPPLDVDKAVLAVGGDRALFDEALQAFLSNLDRMMDRLRSAVREQDAESLHATAHSLKGGASTIAAESVRFVAARLEELGSKGQVQSACELARELESEVVRLQDFVTTLHNRERTDDATTLSNSRG
jgi:HPt (histidine-containing phosphotransfer) domain-containing protein